MAGLFESRELTEEGNTTPESISYGLSAVSDFVANYGWYLLFGVIGLVYINSWLDTRLQGWRKQRKQDADFNKYNADEVMRRQEAVARARERLQAQYNEEAKEHAQRQKEKEEQKQQEEIEDWERHQKGLGYKSKKKRAEEEQVPGLSSRAKSDKPKRRIRDDYNPLWGGQGSGFRPARRGFSGGGG